MTPTRSACTVLLLSTLAAVAPAFDVEMRPTTIPGCFFHPEVGMMYVPLPKNLEMPHVAEVSGACTATVWFNRAGAVDTLHLSRQPEPGELTILHSWSELATAKLVWSGSEWPQNGLCAEVALSAMHYDSLGNARPEEPVEDAPHRRTLVPRRRVVAYPLTDARELKPKSPTEARPALPKPPALPPKEAEPPKYGPPMVMEIVRVRAYTATQPAFPARIVRPEFGRGIDMVEGVEPSLYYVPNVCVVRMPTITVSQEQAEIAGFVGEKRMGVHVRFGPSGRADHVDLYWPSGSAPIDSLLARTARKATLRRSPGVSFAAQPTVEMRYRATVLRLRGGQNPDIFRGWLEPEALQLVTTE